MGPKIFGILFIVFVLGVAVYINQSGVLSNVSNLFPQKSTSTIPTSTPVGTEIKGEINQWVPQPTQPPPSPINPSDIPAGFGVGDLSPYFKKVRISGVSPGSLDSQSHVTLSGNYGVSVPVDITGWRLQANRGSQIIPRIVNDYDPTGLAPESDIIVKEGDYVEIYSTISAIGRNLRINKCIGYLENHIKFDPGLGASCPYRDLSGIGNFTGICQDYIRSLGNCAEPVSNPPVPANDYACRAFLQNFNYRGCYEKYRADKDFLSNKMYVWTGSKFLDFRHDRVLLLDPKGLLVDIYSY